MRTLYVAAGGGGDAVGALLARRALGDTDERPPLVTTCAWERLRIDPVPGPRARTDFRRLGLVGGQACEVLSTSDTVPAGRSVLPRLAETSGARVFLHDFEGGAVGLAVQLQRLSASLEVDRLVVLDVGGDVLARGPEPTLKSPLADSLTLAAALATGIPSTLVVLGPGSDAEIPEEDVVALLGEVGGSAVGRVAPEDVQRLKPVLSWHPTEATALVAAGASGIRGFVAMRRGRDPVPVTDHSSQAWAVPNPTFASFPLAELLSKTRSLSDAEEVMRCTAVNEIDFERSVTTRTAEPQRSVPVAQVISNMRSVGATHITSRRLAEFVAHSESERRLASAQLQTEGLWSISEVSRLSED